MFVKNKSIKPPTKGESIVCDKTYVEGNMFFQSSLHIYGKVKGNLVGQSDQSNLIIFSGGTVRGDIRAANVLVDGQVNGTIICRSIDIHPNAKVNGDIYYEVLQMQANSVINGQLVISDEYAKLKDAKSVSASSAGSGDK